MSRTPASDPKARDDESLEDFVRARDINTRPIDRSRLPGSIREAVESYEAENNRIVDDTLEDILEAFLHWYVLKIFEACLETPPE